MARPDLLRRGRRAGKEEGAKERLKAKVVKNMLEARLIAGCGQIYTGSPLLSRCGEADSSHTNGIIRSIISLQVVDFPVKPACLAKLPAIIRKYFNMNNLHKNAPLASMPAIAASAFAATATVDGSATAGQSQSR